MKLTSRKLSRRAELELPMASTIDVVFLLLIFFMVTAAFRETEKELKVGIKKQSESATTPRDLQPAIVDIVPAGDGFAYKIGSRQVETSGELEAILNAFTNKGDGAFVKVRNEVPAGMAAAAIQACKDAEFESVTYVPITR